MHIANKVRFNFDTHDFTFNSKFPDGEIREVMSQDEFDDIMNKLNVEFAEKLHRNALEIQKWFKIVGFGSLVIVGIFFLPVLMTKSNKQSKYLTEFYDDVKEYLYRQNKKKFLKRKIEWKLIKDKKLAKGKDAGNLEAQMHVEIIFESSSARRETENIQAYTAAPLEPTKKPKRQKLTLYDTSSEEENEDDDSINGSPLEAGLLEEDAKADDLGTVEQPEDAYRGKSMLIDDKIMPVSALRSKGFILEEKKRKERHHHRRHHHRAKKAQQGEDQEASSGESAAETEKSDHDDIFEKGHSVPVTA